MKALSFRGRNVYSLGMPLFKKLIYPIICMSLLVSSTAKTQYQVETSLNNSSDHFDETLPKWLAHIGFNGNVLEYQKLFDSMGYIDYFHILLEEGPTVSETKKVEDRQPAKILGEMFSDENFEYAHINVIGKDLKGVPYMYFDWLARYAISFAIKKVSKMLSLQSKIEKLGKGLYKVTIEPAATTEPSRYRFTQINVVYEIHNLFLNLDVQVKGTKDYLMLSYLKSELDGILRALENGHFPGSTSETLVSGLLKGTSDHLILDLLKAPEAAHETLLKLERNPEVKGEELEPADLF